MKGILKGVKYFNPLQWGLIIAMIIVNYLTGGFTDWILSIATITGVICVVMVGKGAIGNYAFGFINALAYGVIALQAGVLGDAMENLLFFLPTQIIGYFIWKKRMNKDTKVVKAKNMNWKQILISLGIIIVGTFGFAQILNALGGNVVYYDSATNILTIFAQILMLLCFSEQWIIWILVNILSVITWVILAIQGDLAAWTVAAMWGLYLVNAIYSYINWRKLARNTYIF